MLWAEHIARNTAAARDDVCADVKREFDDAEFVELTGVSGLFALSNRFQDSMLLPIEEQHEVDKIRASVRADPAKLKTYLERLIATWPQSCPRPVSGAPRAVQVNATRSAAPRVPLIDPAAARGDAKAFLDSADALLGGVPNLLRAWAHVPHVGKFVVPLWVALTRDGSGGELPAALKSLAQIRIAAVLDSPYALAHATALAQAAGVADSRIAAAAMTGDPAVLDARERAVADWAAGVARNAARSDEAGFAALKAHCDDAAVVEITALCAFWSMVALFANALALPTETRESLAALYRSPAIDHLAVRAWLARLLADWPARLPDFR